MIIKTLLSTGHFISAERFLNFILSVNEGKHEDIRIMYGIRERRNLKKRFFIIWRATRTVNRSEKVFCLHSETKWHLWNFDRCHLSFHYQVSGYTRYCWRIMDLCEGMITMVAENWQKQDRGIWEIRKESRHFVFSKVLSWVAVDRGCKIARIVGKQDYEKEWSVLKEKSEKIFTSTGGSGTESLHAVIWKQIAWCFPSPNRRLRFYRSFRSNVCKHGPCIRDNLSDEGMMYRYKNEDDFGKPRNSLIICTFWLIDALCKIGLNKDAEALFEKMLKSSNHLGLFSEHINVKTGELLGNFPRVIHISDSLRQPLQ